MRAVILQKFTRFVLTAAAVVALSAAVQAADQFKPADFGGAAQAIKQAVQVPALSDELPVVGVYCQSDVAADGGVSNVVCYEREGFDDLRQQTEQAVQGRTFEPAQVDGTPVPVRMHFRVVYSNLEGQDPVLVLPNLGNMQKTYGYYYHGPQERLDQHRWYEAYQDNDWSEGKLFFSNEGRLTRLVAIVGADGEPIVVRRIEARRRHARDVVEIEKQLMKSRFIPGFANGEPQRMQYVAVLHYSGKE